MAFNNPGTSARPGRAAVVAAFVAVQTILALHTGASAQIASPSLPAPPFVAPIVKTAAAPAGTPAATTAVAPACNTATPTAHLDRPLLRTMRTLAGGDPLTIVTIGSSSTAGAGATSPAASYPNRLAVELRQRFPDRDITVFNRGNNGEETNEMRARFAADVFAAHPQLVIWQVGSNSVLRDRPLDRHQAELREGIDELKAAGADVVLIDLQYAPGLLAKPETPDMLERLR